MIASIPNWLFIAAEIFGCAAVAVVAWAIWTLVDACLAGRRLRDDMRRTVERIEREVSRGARWERRA